MKSMKFFCLLVFVAFCAQDLVAQKEKERKSEVIKLGGEATDAPSKGGGLKMKLHAKIAPVEFLFGAQSVCVEVGLADWFSIETAVGVTFRPVLKNNEIFRTLKFDYGSSDYMESDQWDYFLGEEDIIDNPEDYSYRKATPGYKFTFSPRIFYRIDEGLDGWYIAPLFQYTRWNFMAQQALRLYRPFETDIVRATDYTQKEMFQKMDIFVNTGVQQLFDLFLFDMGIGVGASFQKGVRQDLGTENDYVDTRELTFTQFKFDFQAGL